MSIMIRYISILLCCLFTTINLFAQEETFKKKFLEANTLIEEKLYHVALPLWIDLQKEQPENSNLNYKVGVCYIESKNQKAKALSYLTAAAKNVSNNYDPYSHTEKKAPKEVYFYLARAQHLSYQLDDALSNYDTFKGKTSKKHFLYSDIDKQKKYCENAKIAVANPVKTEIKNLGAKINSKYEDYSPAVLFDESTIYFTSRRLLSDSSNMYIIEMSDGKFYEDIYVSYKYNGTWTEPTPININTTGHEAVVNVSTDGKTLFIYRDDNGDGNIYQSNLEGNGEWSYPVSLDSNINQKSQETHAHLSPDGKSLYFVSDRENGNGGKDIYVCDKLADGSWDIPKNVGNVINTPADEDGVFIHPDGKTMYFSSNNENSIGGYDVFSSTLDANGNWSQPVNMGYPINTADNDLFFVTSADGKR
ncbi:MAG: TolB family protein, partial [Vicingaceae bacterium]